MNAALHLGCKELLLPTTNFLTTRGIIAGFEFATMNYLHQASFVISVLGVLVIVLGVLTGLVRFLRSEISAARGNEVSSERQQLRHALGYYLLLGLEFLIAADIIDTLMQPTLQELGALGAIVLIRTVISYSLTAELKSEQHHKATS